MSDSAGPDLEIEDDSQRSKTVRAFRSPSQQMEATLILFSPSLLSATPFSVTTQPVMHDQPVIKLSGYILVPTNELGWCHVKARIIDLLPHLVSLAYTLRRDPHDRQFASLDVPTPYLSRFDLWTLFNVNPTLYQYRESLIG